MSYVRPFANEECCAGANDASVVCAGCLCAQKVCLVGYLWSDRLDGSENGHLRVRRRRESRKEGFVGCGENTVMLEEYG